MKRLIVWLNLLIKKNKKMKRWKRIVTVMAAIITFVTTYALILPAITVEKDKTDQVSGMYLEEVSEIVGEGDDMLEENALVPTSFVIAADQENAVTYSYEDDDIFAELVISTEEEIPEGTELAVNYIDPESEEYAGFSSRAMDLLSREFINEISTCSFYDFALVCDNVDVTPGSGFADIRIFFHNNTVEHTDDALFVGKFALPLVDEGGLLPVSADETAVEDETADENGDESPAPADENAAADELMSVNGDETAVLELSEGIITSLSLKGCDLSRDDSVVGILAGFVDEELKAAASEEEMELSASEDVELSDDLNDAELPDDAQEEDLSPAPSAGTFTAYGNDYTVKLTYDETSGVPSGASFEVSEIARDSKEYKTYLKEAKKAMGLTEEEVLPQYAARFFDIKIMVDGKEFIPESGVTVEIAYTEPLAANPETEVSAVHFQDGTSEPEVIDASATGVAEDGTATVEFQAESFSVYGIVYTVDFYWEVNGQTYEFNLPGGGFVSFRQLVEMLRIAPVSEFDDEAEADVNGTVETDESAAEADVDGTVETNDSAEEMSIVAAKDPEESTDSVSNGTQESNVSAGSETEDVDSKAEDRTEAASDIEETEAKESNVVGSSDDNDLTEAPAAEIDADVNSDESRPLSLKDVVVSENTRKFVADVEKVEFSSPDLVWVGKVDEATTVGALKEANALEVQYSARLTQEQISEINAAEVESGDWALISMLPFESEEVLTVTMKTGEVFTIKVTDAQSDAIIKDDGSGTVQTISNPSGTTIDLFDYWIVDGLKNETGKAAWPNYNNQSNGNTWFLYYAASGTFNSNGTGYDNPNGLYLYGTGTNKGINSNGTTHGHAFKFTPAQAGSVIDGTLASGNWNQESIDSVEANDPSGLTGGLNSWTHNATPRQGIVENELNENGYPKLTTDPNMGTDGEDLDYLFDPDMAHAGKEYKGEVDHLLYVDPNGFYTYESHDFEATYVENDPNDKTDGEFVLTPYADSVTGDPRGFWPFGSQKFWVGVHMETDFSMPIDGEVLNPKGEYKDMVFEFKGDDDTWLYVDGILVGDGGGVHNQTQISVNFRSGTVNLTGKNDQLGYASQYDETLYLYDIYIAADPDNATNYEWVPAKNPDGTILTYPEGHTKAGQPVLTFANGSEHTFDMFYLERGGGMSNLYIHYNLVSTTEFSAHKAYSDLQGGNSRMYRDDFAFELVGYDGAYDANGELIPGLEDQTAIMPNKGSASGQGTADSPKKVHYEAADGEPGYTSLITGVTEDGNVNFGDIELETNVWAPRLGQVYRYAVRELPGDKDTTYDEKVYYFTGTVVYENGKYKLKKTRYLDENYTIPDPDTTFNSFVNGLQPVTLKTVKKYKPDNGAEQLLPGAEFSLTPAIIDTFELDSNGKIADCTWVEKEGATSVTGTTGSDGTLNFTGLKEGYYILEETAAPAGYQRGDTYRWLVKVLKQDSDGVVAYVPTIVELDEDGSPVDNGSHTLVVNNNTSTYEVLNTPHEPIQISVEKQWQDADMSEVENINAYSADFTLERLKTEITVTTETNIPETSTLQIGYYDNQTHREYELYDGKSYVYEAGSTATVTYNYKDGHNSGQNSGNWRRYRVELDDGTVLKNFGNNEDIGDNGTIDIVMPANGRTVTVYFWDNWEPWDGAFEELYAQGTIAQTTQTTHQVVSDEVKDDDFSEAVTIHGNETKQFVNTHDNVSSQYDFPIIVKDGNKTTIYKYYIVEGETNMPSDVGNFETIYIINGKEMSEEEYLSNTENNLMPDGGTQKIINRKLINIPVEKRWPDYEQGGYTWEAELHMDYREVPITLEDEDPTTWGPYHEDEDDEGDYIITLGNTTGHTTSGSFSDLPAYVTDAEGNIWRREYSVVELSYTVWEGDTVVASFDGEHYLPDENHKYALWYQHDAGEDSNYHDENYPGEETYNILVYNMHENRTTQKDIGLEIDKVWEDAEGEVIDKEDLDGYKAEFVLKRNIVVEYRNYENIVNPLTPDGQRNPDYCPREQWLWVKLVAGDYEQVLQVPPGRQMYIRGNLVEGENPGSVKFRDANNVEYTASKDDDPSFAGYNLFKVPFNAPSDSTNYSTVENAFTITLVDGSDSVIGREDGFILSDSNDRQVIGADGTFSKEFELSNENDWHHEFPKSIQGEVSDDPQQQFENEHQLPAIEVSTLDQYGNTANTYIYTYYFEEVKCTPDTFYATFTDDDGKLIGNAIYSDGTITATNRPIGFDILKVNEDKPTVKLKDAEFQLRKLAEDEELGYPVPTQSGTIDGTVIDTKETAEDGKASFTGRPTGIEGEYLPGLLPGYYEVTEVTPPTGYLLTEDVVFYLKVETTGEVKLLKKEGEGSEVRWSEAAANEQVGKVTYTSTSTKDGLSIVYTVRNVPGAALPNAGGSGTRIFTILGSIMVILAGALLIRRKTFSL